jgi:hypothetical protein
MNMVGFTAEAALYKTSGHYQTNRNLINLPTQIVGLIYPAEVIEVHGCRPGHLQLGEGDDMVCIDPQDPFPGPGGGDGPGVGPGAGPTGGGGTQARPPRRPRPPRPPHRKFTSNDANSCSPDQLNTSFGSACVDQLESDITHNRPINHEAICDSTGKISCCRVAKNNDILSCASE